MKKCRVKLSHLEEPAVATSRGSTNGHISCQRLDDMRAACVLWYAEQDRHVGVASTNMVARCCPQTLQGVSADRISFSALILKSCWRMSRNCVAYSSLLLIVISLVSALVFMADASARYSVSNRFLLPL